VVWLAVATSGWGSVRDRAAARTARSAATASSNGLRRTTTQQHGKQQGVTGAGGAAISSPAGCLVLIRIAAPAWSHQAAPITPPTYPITESKNLVAIPVAAPEPAALEQIRSLVSQVTERGPWRQDAEGHGLVATPKDLAERSAPLLPPGSQVRQAFVCQTAPNFAFFVINWATGLTMFWITYRCVAVTRDAIYVLDGPICRAAPGPLRSQVHCPGILSSAPYRADGAR
jgi:hypothetical protein